MQHCSSGSLSLLAKCNGKASETLGSVLLLGVDSSHDVGEGVEEEGGEEEGVAEVVAEVMMAFDHEGIPETESAA